MTAPRVPAPVPASGPRILRDMRAFAEQQGAYPDELEEYDEAIAALLAQLAAAREDTDRLEWAWREGFFSGGEARPSFLPRPTLDELREAIDDERAAHQEER